MRNIYIEKWIVGASFVMTGIGALVTAKISMPAVLPSWCIWLMNIGGVLLVLAGGITFYDSNKRRLKTSQKI
jgi:hypothetical protein